MPIEGSQCYSADTNLLPETKIKLPYLVPKSIRYNVFPRLWMIGLLTVKADCGVGISERVFWKTIWWTL